MRIYPAQPNQSYAVVHTPFTTIEIISQTPQQLVLKTNPKYRLSSGCILLPMLAVGIVSVALGTGWLLLLIQEAQSLFQSLWLIFIGVLAITGGIAMPIHLLLNATTVQMWTFTHRDKHFRRIRKRFCRTKVFDYPLHEVTRVYINQLETDEGTIYRIELVFSANERLPISYWSPTPETTTAECIHQFLQLPGQV